MDTIDLMLKAGRAGVELALFLLLPIMVVMLALMRVLEARGVLDWVVARLTGVLRPFGLTGLAVFAALQINFVSFAAPVAALAMMGQRGASDRHLAAALAMVFAMQQANVGLPMSAIGLHFGFTLLFSIVGGLFAAAITYHVIGRGLSDQEARLDDTLAHPVAENTKAVLDVINRAGAEAFRIATGAIPMLVLSLVVVALLRHLGAVDRLTTWLTPALTAVHLDPVLVLPAFTKMMAGGTAMLGVVDELRRTGQVDATFINQSAGLLLHPFDLPGVAVLMSAHPRVAAVWRPAAWGAVAGIALRSAAHAWAF